MESSAAALADIWLDTQASDVQAGEAAAQVLADIGPGVDRER